MKRTIVYIAGVSLALAAASCNHSNIETARNLSSKNEDASCLSLVQAPGGRVFAAWAEADSNQDNPHFCLTAWDEKADSFVHCATIPLDNQTSLNQENNPKLVFTNQDSAWLIYVIHAPTADNKYASSIQYRVSGDAGKTWSSPHRFLQDSTAGQSLSYISTMRLPNGRLAFCWLGSSLSQSQKGRPLFYAEAEGIDRFSKPVLLDSFACQCCRNSIAQAPNGKMSIIYRSLRQGSVRDIAFVCRPSGGSLFSKPVVFSGDHWVVDGCPEDGPVVVASDSQNAVVWFTGSGSDKGVHFAQLDNQGRVLAKQKIESLSRFIQLAADDDGHQYVVYNHYIQDKENKASSMIMLRDMNQPENKAMTLTSKGEFAGYPVIAAQKNRVFVAWLGQQQVRYRVVTMP